ncbi:MAG TPA: DUF4175 family protein [Acetobacteraceae bacterium]|nr:DUF4175 family protein [Acetobacteraceae bacterium]
MNAPENPAGALHRRLALRRALARLAILFERLWPALWPPIGVIGLLVCLALLNVLPNLPPLIQLAVLVIGGLAVVALLVRGLHGITRPDDAAADRRLERASGLRHRPLSVLVDRPSATDEAGTALWQAHVIRAAAQIRRLRIGLPRPGLARRDPRALRGALVVALVACVGIAGTDSPARLWASLQPTLPREASAPSTQLQSWITPPPYTHIAPVFMKPELRALSVPAGSHLTASVTGGSGTPVLTLDGRSAEFKPLDQASFQADQDLVSGGRLAIRRNGAELAGWDLTVVADQPPTTAWAEPPGPATTDRQHLRLPWRASDDYGVVSLEVEMRLRDRTTAPPLVVTIPVAGESKSIHGVQEQDLTAHPWAGLPVTAHLVARDAPGQVGRSAEATFVLPERSFQNPVARALIAIRKGLSLHPDDRDAAVGGLDALLLQPKAFKDDYGAYLNLSSIYYLLEHDQSADAIPQAQRQMWELALHMEEGGLDRTARALEQARQAAKDALQKALQDPDKANRQALEQRLKELQQAIQNRMQALMEQLRRNGQEIPPQADAQRLSSQDMQKLADQAREAAKQGRMADAQQRMAELERMLDALRNARAMTAEEMQRAQQRQRGQQQMGAVQDMIGRQGGLLDHSQQRTQSPGPDQQNATPSPSQPGDEAQQREADQRVQQALRRALGEMMQQFGDLTGKIPPSLGDADQAMRDATQALGQGQDKAAGDAEQRAIEALQKGGQQMSQQMAQQFGNGQSGQGNQPGDQPGLALQDGPGDGPGFGPLPGRAGRRDPLGRRFGEGHNGADETDEVTVPDQAARQRAQEIERTLRERGADRTRPQEELDYINRLLKQF